MRWQPPDSGKAASRASKHRDAEQPAGCQWLRCSLETRTDAEAQKPSEPHITDIVHLAVCAEELSFAEASRAECESVHTMQPAPATAAPDRPAPKQATPDPLE